MWKKTIAALLALICLGFGAVSCAGSEGSDTETASTISEVDVDLAGLAPSDQYAKSLEISQSFDSYVGKTVRVSGTYQEQTYHFIIIYDGTCCTNYFEFLYNGSMPATGDAIELTGTFGYYSDDVGSYPYIDVKELKKI